MTRSGTASIWLLVVGMLCTAAIGGGYYAGRYVLGEDYLKKHAVAVRAPQPVPVAPRPQAASPPQDTQSTATITPLRSPRRAFQPAAPPQGENNALGLETPPAPEPTPAPAEEVTIQLGSFADKANADMLVADLKQRGVAASARQEAGGIYRVRTGVYKRDKAEAAAEDLRRRGYNAIIVPKE